MARNKKNVPAPPPEKEQRPRMTVNRAKEDIHNAGQQEGSPGILVTALIGSMAFIGWYYHLVVLQQFTQLSDGIAALDQRISGYTVDEASALAAVLDADALGQLNWVHKTAGVIFPLMVGLTVSVVGAWCLRKVAMRWLVLGVSVVFVVVDIWENIAIEAALHEPVAATVQLASTLTVLRWFLLAVLLIWMVALLAVKLLSRGKVGTVGKK